MDSNNEKFLKAYRKIHMDFHNPPFFSELGSKFNATEYVKIMKDANVNGLVTFSKCHHGNSYYPTKVGTIHPAILHDMMGEIIDECVKQDITPIIYYSVSWDRRVALSNQDWLQRTKTGENISHRVFDFICLNSPYKEEVVFPQLEEIIQKYHGFIGFWLDIVRMAPSGCYCEYCQRKFLHNFGHSLQEVTDGERIQFLDQSTIEFFEEAKKRIKKYDASMLVTFNQSSLFNQSEPGKYDALWTGVDFISVESHTPDYGDVPKTLGILDASFKAKYCRGFGILFEITPSRFIHSWGAWDLLPEAHFITVFSQIASQGGVINCGDQAYPDGRLDRGVYYTIGNAYRYLQKREPWFTGKEEVPNVCLLANAWKSAFQGAGTILTQLQIPFTVRDTNQLKREKALNYRVIICAGDDQFDEDDITLLKQYIQDGGKILLDASSSKFQFSILKDLFGVSPIEPSPYTMGYLDFSPLTDQNQFFQIPLLVNGSFLKIEPITARKVIEWFYPYTESTSERFLRHSNSPPYQKSLYPAVTINSFGRGNTLFIAAPLFRDFWENCHWYLKPAFQALFHILESQPLIAIEENNPIDLEISLSQSAGEIQVHLLTYIESPKTVRFSLIEKNPVLHGIKMNISKKLMPSLKSATLQPRGENVVWSDESESWKIKLPKIQGYEILVMEK